VVASEQNIEAWVARESNPEPTDYESSLSTVWGAFIRFRSLTCTFLGRQVRLEIARL